MEIIQKVYSSQKLTFILKVLSAICVLATLPVFLLVIYKAYTVSIISAVKAALMLAIPFVAVTAFRNMINAPRPYELYPFFEEAPKKKAGRSFPSRHCFSIFSIGTLAVFAYPVIGAVLLVMGVILAFCRVLLGIHFIRDCIVGALIGVFSSVVGVIIFSPFSL